MNEWSKEQLEEMFGDNVIEQLAFLSGCTKHSYCDPSHTDLNGYIVSHEKLEKFAEILVKECIKQCNSRVGNSDYNTGRMHCASDIREHFGVEE